MVRGNRRRYVVVHLLSPEGVGKGLLIKMTRDRTRELESDTFDRMKPWVVYHHNDWAVIRTGHRGCAEFVEILRSLDGIELREGKLRLRVVGVSGTLRSAFFKHIPGKARTGHHYREEDR